MVAIIILNWNGHDDTIACLESLYKMSYKDFFIILGDNGSKDNSLGIFAKWCNDNNRRFSQCQLGDIPPTDVKQGDIILYDLKENHGFARGNNLMIKFISLLAPHYFFLLNNDTEVTLDFMQKLVDFADKHSQYSMLTPQIRYFFNQTHVWNCGGNIKLGMRKYHYGNRPYTEITEKEIINCSFVTGCALLFKKEVLNDVNELFTEKYFFGEEDFELSLRLKKEGKKMACYIPSVIYHKVGSSTRKTGSLKRSYVHYLNRFINVRHYYSNLGFVCWELCYLPYVFMVVIRKGNSIRDVMKFVNRLHKECRLYDGVNKQYFEQIMSPNFEI